ncbi:hypothetical protein [Natrialba taiwanensis]|uniref:Uncharacterized protein n=1 Tax=Natrialba taiwanensis DSM 12281 TaxID=1230458 RepID=L9ZT65_9EURY|nr:hypothetical protein [Natrialba taiwanensis]ELY89296.1 hypothetical protein C484_13395 [Natrialba taiwanensis DSM 12281]
MDDTSSIDYALSLDRFAFTFAIGLLLMGYSAVTYWQVAYSATRPTVSNLSPGLPNTLLYLAVFLIGAVLAFAATMTALYKVLQDADFQHSR